MILLSNFKFVIKKIFGHFKKCSRTYSVTDLNTVSNTPVYNNFDTVFIFYLKNNLDLFYRGVISWFNKNGFFPVVGIEIEFYISEKSNNSEFYESVRNFCLKNNISILGIDKELGSNQVEIKFDKYTNLEKLISDYNILKNFLIDNFSATFSTAPLLNDAFSALQININLVDKYGNNLFARNIDNLGNKIESDLLINSVNGVLYTTNIFLPFYINSEDCLRRFDLDRNNNLYSSGKIPAPTFISWGINNRTTSIRIPTPKDFTNYEEIDKRSRRIEFRIPSSDADVKMCIFGVLISILYGIKNDLNIYEKTNFNVLKNNENLKRVYVENTSMLDENIYNFFREILFLKDL